MINLSSPPSIRRIEFHSYLPIEFDVTCGMSGSCKDEREEQEDRQFSKEAIDNLSIHGQDYWCYLWYERNVNLK